MKITCLMQSERKKIFSCIWIVLVLFVFSPLANSQNQRVQLRGDNLTLISAFKQIEQQTKMSIDYDAEIINVSQQVAPLSGLVRLDAAMKHLLQNTKCVYSFQGMHILISNHTQTDKKKEVSGTVLDEQGNVIIGANILEKGSVNGTTTDVNGKFSLYVSEGTILQISYLGYITKNVSVGKQDKVSVKLEEDTQLLDEVVVVGYGTVKRKNFTGSVSTIEFENSPVAMSPRTNVMDALRGTVTGTTISRETSAGSSPSIEIHGQKSISSASSNPLIVLDGIIYMGSWRDIDLSTIESMSVLKDAISLAAYGSQAANGVIMITTKKGKIGKPIITFDASLSVSNKTMMPDLMSPDAFVEKTNISKGVTDGNPQSWMKPTLYDNYLKGQTTDWLDYSTRTGYTQKYSVSVSGASEKFNYFISMSHADQRGIVIGDDYKREALSVRLQNDITDWLQVGIQTNYTYNNYDGVTADIRPYLSPYGQPVRPNGALEKYVAEEGGNHVNPLWNTEKGGTVDDYERYSQTMLKGNLLLKAPWITGLSYRLNLSYSEENYQHDKFTHEGNFVTEGSSYDDERYAPETLAGYLSKAEGSNERKRTSSYIIDNILNYNAQLNKHFIDLTAVYTRDENVIDTRTLNGSDFSAIGNTLLGYDGLAFGTIQKVEISKIRKANAGYLGRVNYNYDDRYHFSASVRRDGSSVFGSSKKWGVFPAFGAAWTVTEESFMKKNDILDYLKVKASWGKNGNQSLEPYGTLSTIDLGQNGKHPYLFGNTGEPSWGQFVSAIGNSELGWETTTTFNIGFEVRLLKERINFEFDAYKSKTTDQIFSRFIPVMGNGFDKTKATMGQINNWGIEFTLNTVNIQNNDFRWTSMLNFYLNRNKLVDLYGDGKDDIGSSLFIGKSLGAIYGYKNIGIVQEDELEYITANNTHPGYPKFENIDGSSDNKITSEDRTILGYKKENFRMNMAHTFSYKNWDLYFLFTGVFGGGSYGMETNSEAFITFSDPIVNLDHPWWTAENRNNVYPTINFTGGNYTPVMSYAFVRLQDLNLSYSFRQMKIKNWGINNLQIYLSAKNLFTITNWEGGDPETKQRFGMGGLLSYPLQRTFSFGLNLSF